MSDNPTVPKKLNAILPDDFAPPLPLPSDNSEWQNYPDEDFDFDAKAYSNTVAHQDTKRLYTQQNGGPDNPQFMLRGIDPQEETQQELTSRARARAYFEATEDDPKEVYRDAAIKFHCLGGTNRAEFYDEEGSSLSAADDTFDIFTTISISLESHMPHFRILARGKPVLPKGEDNGMQPDENDETKFLALNYKPKVNEDAADSIASRVSAYVNFEAYQDSTLVNCQEGADLPEELRAYLGTVPRTISQRITEMNREGQMPFILEILFDPALAALERVFMGTPTWANKLADALAQGRVFALVEGHELLTDRIQILRHQFQRAKTSKSPLRQYQNFGSRRLVFTTSSLRIPDIRKDNDDQSAMYYRPRHVFHSLDEYNTVQAVSVLSEKRKMYLDADSFGDTSRLRCAQLPGVHHRVMLGWLPIPDESTFRARSGDRCNIIFLNPGETAHDLDMQNKELLARRTFKGKVATETVTSGPQGYVPVHISRPYDKKTGVFYEHNVHYIDVIDVSPAHVPWIVRNDKGNRVVIEWNVQAKVFSCQLNAIELFGFPGKKVSPLDWNMRARTVVVGSQIHTLEPVDVLAAVRKSPIFQGRELVSYMHLNEGQANAIRGLRYAPGGFTIIQGPPGTGKSRIWEELIRIILLGKIRFQVMITSPSNAAVDTIARKLQRVYNDLVEAHSINVKQYILRIHSAGAENAIGRMEAEKTRRTDGQRPDDLPASIMRQLDEVTKLFLHQYRAATKTEFDGIYDPRVRLPGMAAMAIAIERAGIIPGPLTVAETSKFAMFRQLYNMYARGDDFNITESVEWNKAVGELWTDTLQNAAVIVSTTAQASMARVLEPLSDTCRLLIIDDAAHQAEVGLIPFFAARFSKMEGCIQIGDVFQLSPMVLSTTRENIYSDQGRISLMARMASIGFPTFTLNEQHRFVEELASLANNTTYNHCLINTKAAKRSRREIAQAFTRFTQKHMGRRANKLLFDVANGAANKVESTATHSRFNELFVIIAAIMVCELLEVNAHATIAVLSAYKAQKDRYTAMVNNMRAKGVPGVERVTVATSDSVQGEQYDYVVLDILVPTTDPTLGFQGDQNRLTMQTTRARNGLIIITNLKALLKCKQAERGYISKMINEFQECLYRFGSTAVLIPSPFYRPLSTLTQNARAEMPKSHFVENIDEGTDDNTVPFTQESKATSRKSSKSQLC